MPGKLWRIVIIDDSPEDRAEARRCLLTGSDRRYQFLEAENGEQGVRACLEANTTAPVDCVVLDYQLPDLTAFEVLHALTGGDGGPSLPVVVLTGSVGHEHARSLVRAGAQDYMGKGWMTAESLTRAIDNAIERWTMARELRASEERFARAQRAGHIGTWDWDMLTGETTWTEEAWHLFGRAPFTARVDQDYFVACMHPDDRAATATAIALALNAGSFHTSFRVLRHDGSVRWLDSKGEVLFDADRKPLRMLGTVQDVTERKHDADSLREREQRLRLALRAGSTGVWSWDIASGHVQWSDEAFVIMGVAPSEFEGSFYSFERLLHPDDRTRIGDSVREAVQSGTEYRSEFRIIRPDGAVRRVTNLGIVERDADGRAFSMVGTITDVTEQRAGEDALREREQQLQAVADNTPQILARFDRELRHVFVNIAAERATGLPIAAFLGKTNRELGMPAALCEEWERELHAVFETGRPTTFEFTFEGPSGPRCFASRLVPEFGRAGAIEHALCVSHDITVHKEAEASLREADRRKDEFLATLAHELRNPLAPIRTGLELLKHAADRASQTRTLAIMDRQVGHMVRLIDDLMDVSRIASGKVTLQRERVCLQDILSAAVETARAAIERARHELSVELPQVRVVVDGDAARLVQVVGNLLTNAAKYTPNGGRILLRLCTRDAHAEISVEDTGLGIPPEMLGRIFDMFTQVNQTLERSQGGLGIGLALVQRLVNIHGGSVQAHSAGAGRGSTFTVRLPLAAARVALGPEVSPPTAASRTRRCRALVVDDNVDAAETLAQMLALYGSEVRIAFDGAEALRIAAAFQPEIVFLDIGMPGMSGYDAARHFRSDPALAKVTLVAVTGWGSEDDRKRSREAGFDHHHTKPLTAHTVSQLICAVLD